MIENLILWIIIAVISAIPLNLAAKLLGGESSILKVIFINIFYGFLVGLITIYFSGFLNLFLPIVLFVLLLFIYKISFEVGWIKALFIWISQFIILTIITVILFLFGISLGIAALTI